MRPEPAKPNLRVRFFCFVLFLGTAFGEPGDLLSGLRFRGFFFSGASFRGLPAQRLGRFRFPRQTAASDRGSWRGKKARNADAQAASGGGRPKAAPCAPRGFRAFAPSGPAGSSRRRSALSGDVGKKFLVGQLLLTNFMGRTFYNGRRIWQFRRLGCTRWTSRPLFLWCRVTERGAVTVGAATETAGNCAGRKKTPRPGSASWRTS